MVFPQKGYIPIFAIFLVVSPHVLFFIVDREACHTESMCTGASFEVSSRVNETSGCDALSDNF